MSKGRSESVEEEKSDVRLEKTSLLYETEWETKMSLCAHFSQPCPFQLSDELPDNELQTAACAFMIHSLSIEHHWVTAAFCVATTNIYRVSCRLHYSLNDFNVDVLDVSVLN